MPLIIVHSANPLSGGCGQNPVDGEALVSGVEHHEQSVEQRLQSEVLQSMQQFYADSLF
jgi:hypothetical protein